MDNSLIRALKIFNLCIGILGPVFELIVHIYTSLRPLKVSGKGVQLRLVVQLIH